MKAVRTTCAYCGVGCGIAATVTGDRQLRIKGDMAHAANRGALCSKGTHLAETVGLDGRLLHPMIGDQQVGWDAALDDVATRMRDCIDQHGPGSVAFYVSGQLLTEDYYVANKLMKGFVGSANIDTNSRLCMASAVAAHNRAFGEDVVPCTFEDLDCADLFILVGSNTAWCHPVVWQRIEKTRERRGAKIVVIDPRRTETAERADLHIAVDPDGDTRLFNALLAELFERGAVDQEFLAEKCAVPTDFWGSLDADPGIPASQFRKLVSLVSQHERMITLFSQGANQSIGGTDKGNAVINLHLATGRINRMGMGPFSITGQPNAMGGREVGGLANMLACHLGFSEEERAAAADFWQTDRICAGPGLKAVDLFQAVHDGRVKFLWVIATNPAVSMPDAGFVREALARCPNVVVSDVLPDTDTAKYAHVRLPAEAWAEKDGTVTNSERRVSRQRRLFPSPGEARADWRIICDVAARMGHGDAFDFANAAAIFREYAAMTALSVAAGKQLDLTAYAQCSDDEYDALEPFLWGGDKPLKTRFSFPDGRARLVVTQPVAAAATAKEYPLRLNTGRYRDQWHTMTRTGLSARLSIHRREPLLEMHPDDCAHYGLTDGGLAQVATPHGSATYRVLVTAGQRPGHIFVPMHWTDQMGSAGRTGRLIEAKVDPVSGQPGFKDNAAKVTPVEPEWRAFLISKDIVQPDVFYWSRSRVPQGWLTEMAGMGTADIEGILPAGQRSEVADMARGMRRVTVTDDAGHLLAALFLTRTGELPQRDWIMQQLGSDQTTAAEWLAGRPSTPLPDKGPIVCVCHDVGEQQVLAAVAEGATDVAAVGACTAAGTNCGSCRPIIARLIEDYRGHLQEAAE